MCVSLHVYVCVSALVNAEDLGEEAQPGKRWTQPTEVTHKGGQVCITLLALSWHGLSSP